MRRAFVAAAAGWVSALPLAAYAASRPHATSVPYACALAVYGLGSVVCHQLPARSFHLWGVQMPVCARCTGIYVGAALAAAASSVVQTLGDAEARRMLALAALPTIATLIYEWTTGVMPANWIRALAGLPLGAAIALVIAGVGPARTQVI
jgi:uncharacterized membrane protein